MKSIPRQRNCSGVSYLGCHLNQRGAVSWRTGRGTGRRNPRTQEQELSFYAACAFHFYAHALQPPFLRRARRLVGSLHLRQLQQARIGQA